MAWSRRPGSQHLREGGQVRPVAVAAVAAFVVAFVAVAAAAVVAVFQPPI